MELLRKIYYGIVDFMNAVNAPVSTVLVVALALSALWFTFVTRGVQFRLIADMVRLLVASDGKQKRDGKRKHISSFQAFSVSIASRVGTGNLAGVATAIVIGGPGAVFWMWVMALVGAANAFVESTLAQLFKIKGNDSYIGGPAYYIQKGLKSRFFACVFAVSIIACFGFANNMVQSNTISLAFASAFGVDPMWLGVIMTVVALLIFFGGIQRVAKVSAVVVPFMAIVYVLVTLGVIVMRFDQIPHVFGMIVSNAFGLDQAVGGGVGTAIIYGFKRGLFSNEAGEGSAPNVAATATTSHPVNQGLIQALGVYTDTLIICTCTAFLILSTGVLGNGHSGIELTQDAMSSVIGSFGYSLVACAIFMFAFTSIIGNYYYGECNLHFITRNRGVLLVYRLCVGAMVMAGSVSTLELVWSSCDFFMAIMACVNIVAILLLGNYAVKCLNDYMRQKRAGIKPVYHSSIIPEIENDTEAWS